MKNDLLFSIVCPVYNSETFLKRAILSILNQDFLNWELILVNDGSTDNSKNICEEYALRDDRISVINQDNCGQSAARLSGIKMARGEFVLFLDSDDYYLDNALQLLADEAKNNSADAFLYNADKNNQGELLKIYSLESRKTINDKNEILSECFKKRTAGYLWTYCFKRDVLNIPNDVKKTFSKIKYSEDIYLLHYLLVNNINCLTIFPCTLYEYMYNGNSITHNQTVDKVEDRFNVFESVYSSLFFKNKLFPIKTVRTNLGWTLMSYLKRAAKEYEYFQFKEVCLKISKSFIFKKMSNFKKDKYNSFVYFLYKFGMYRKVYSFVRRH